MIVLTCWAFSADCLLPRWLLPCKLICPFSYWWSVMISPPRSASIVSKDVFFVVLVKYQHLSFTVFSLELLCFIVPVGFFAQAANAGHWEVAPPLLEVWDGGFSLRPHSHLYWSALLKNRAISHSALSLSEPPPTLPVIPSHSCHLSPVWIVFFFLSSLHFLCFHVCSHAPFWTELASAARAEADVPAVRGQRQWSSVSHRPECVACWKHRLRTTWTQRER